MEDDFVNAVTDLFKSGQWEEIVEKFHDYPERNRLLWVYPSVENVQFLKNLLRELGCDRILSVGCGSGLLEWIITEATGVPVIGVEIDDVWWRCKYAPPTFIHLLLTTSTDLDKDVLSLLQNSERTAILFCYFNNKPAFDDYLSHYSGKILVIIGPGEGKGVHTDPKPFGDVSDEWILYKWTEVRNSKDFIAVYRKNEMNKCNK